MKRTKFVAWVTVVIALVAGAASLLVPAPPEGGASGGPAAFHSSLVQSVMITIVQLGAALLFIWGLKGFKHQLRVAYGLICVGIVVLGFSNLQLPIVSYFDLSETAYVRGGIITIPYIAPALLVFFGVRHFAKLFQIKTIWMSFWFVMGLAVVSAVAAAGLGSVIKAPGGEQLIASIALSAWTAVFLLASMLVVMSVKRVAGPLYRDALRWFVGARAVVTLTGFAYTLLLVFLGDQTELSKYGGVLATSLVAAFLFLRSGYAFKLINEDQAAPANVDDANIIDVVTFAASQASNPSELDTTLDALRIITTSLKPGQPLTAEQQTELKRVYAAIERYLVEQEPLRRFTVEEVRKKGAQHFGMEYNSFVAMISPSAVGGAPPSPALTQSRMTGNTL